MTLDADTSKLLHHLWRGGSWGYLWRSEDKLSQWIPVGKLITFPPGASNLFFGVNPTGKPRLKTERARIGDIVALNGLYADSDPKAFGGDKAKTLAHLESLAIRPSVIVDSGGGYHGYWLLRDSFVFKSELDRKRARQAQASWVKYVGADDGAKDLARLLRVPGTVNHKKEYAPNFPVVTIVQAVFNRLFTLEELEAAARVAQKPKAQPPEPVPSRDGHNQSVGAALNGELGKLARATEGTRNTQLNLSAFQLGQLVGAGLLDRSEVESRLMDAARATGLEAPEIAATIKSGIEAGMREPRTIPPNASGGAQRPSMTTALINIGLHATLFHTPEGEPHASIKVANHRETWPIRSRSFRRWLAHGYYESEGRGANAQAMQDALAVLEARAVFDAEEHAVFVRLAECDGAFWLDLADKEWRAVEVSATGWRIVPDPPVKFRRARGMLPIPDPVRGGSLEEVRRFLNIGSDDDWKLVASWIAAACRPKGPYPLLALHGGQGTAKSSTSRVLKSILDPSTAALRAEPKEARDLMIAANNGWVIALDNVSHLPAWLSDAICRLATGGGFATRQLFTDDEEAIFEAQRPVVLNGIEELAARGDLLDRSLILYLPDIPPDRRRSELDFWQDFEVAQPRIQGGLLDVISAALRDFAGVRLPSAPRMADFAGWAAACAPALGWSAQDFLNVYGGNRLAAHELALDASPIVMPIQSMVEAGEWSGTATELLNRLNDLTDEKVQRQQAWPKNGRSLSNALRRLVPNLRAVDVTVIFTRENKRRLITLKKQGNSASPASQISSATARTAYARDESNAAVTQNVSSVTQPVTQNESGDASDAEIPVSSEARKKSPQFEIAVGDRFKFHDDILVVTGLDQGVVTSTGENGAINRQVLQGVQFVYASYEPPVPDRWPRPEFEGYLRSGDLVLLAPLSSQEVEGPEDPADRAAQAVWETPASSLMSTPARRELPEEEAVCGFHPRSEWVERPTGGWYCGRCHPPS